MAVTLAVDWLPIMAEYREPKGTFQYDWVAADGERAVQFAGCLQLNQTTRNCQFHA